MKRLVIGLVTLVASIPLLMAASEPVVSNNALTTTAAHGDGSMSFGHEKGGRGWLKFSIQDGDPISGSLLFAGEDHHGDKQPQGTAVYSESPPIEWFAFENH